MVCRDHNIQKEWYILAKQHVIIFSNKTYIGNRILESKLQIKILFEVFLSILGSFHGFVPFPLKLPQAKHTFAFDFCFEY